MPPGGWLIATVFALAALQSVATLIAYGLGKGAPTVFSTPEADVTHLVMNAIMAVMAFPAFGPTAYRGAETLLILVAAGVAISLPARRSTPETFWAHAIGAAYHVLMLVAMAYALALMARSMGAMAGVRVCRSPRAIVTPGRVLAALFAMDALTGSLAVTAFGRQLIRAQRPDVRLHPTRSTDPRAGAPTVARLRLSFIPHLVMDLGMVWMLADLG